MLLLFQQRQRLEHLSLVVGTRVRTSAWVMPTTETLYADTGHDRYETAGAAGTTIVCAGDGDLQPLSGFRVWGLTLNPKPYAACLTYFKDTSL